MQGQPPFAQQGRARSPNAGPHAPHAHQASTSVPPPLASPHLSASAALPRHHTSAAAQPTLESLRCQPTHTGAQPQPSASATPRLGGPPRPISLGPADIMARFGLLTLGHGPDSAERLAPTSEPPQVQSSLNVTPLRDSAVPSRTSCPPASGDDGCIICWCADPSLIFQPCGHLCCCNDCAQAILEGNFACPMCRSPVTSGFDMKIVHW